MSMPSQSLALTRHWLLRGLPPENHPNSFVLDSIQGLLVTGARNGREGLEILVSEREPRYATLQGAEGRVKIPNEALSRILRHDWPAPVAGPDRITASNVNGSVDLEIAVDPLSN